jgi:beta-N-acetylhexosaminidase
LPGEQINSVIFGCEGLSLTDFERRFFAEVCPWGFILFARNIQSPEQVLALTDQFREITGRPDTPILIDQEGGRVQRMKPPGWPQYPSARTLGDIADDDEDAAKRAVWLMSRLHAFDLSAVGINIDCLPLLDVPVSGAHDVIGNRAYGTDLDRVIKLGRSACEGLLAGGVLPVIKHIPGHGRAGVDSHKSLPRVSTSRPELERTDFAPFRALNDQPLGMSAHVVFEDIDPNNPVTTSKVGVSEVIRDFIGFDGLLMTDDLSMQALSGDYAQRAQACFEAGCDIVLHCNGDKAEMEAVAKAIGPVEGDTKRRAENALKRLKSPDDAVEQELRSEFSDLLAKYTSAA